MKISLPDAMREFIDRQVSRAGYSTSSEYVRELICRDQERLQLRGLLIESAQSPVAGEADAGYFAGLRQRIAASRTSAAKAASR